MSGARNDDFLRQRHSATDPTHREAGPEREHLLPQTAQTSSPLAPSRKRKRFVPSSAFRPYIPIDGSLPRLSAVLPRARTFFLISSLALALRILLLVVTGPALRTRPELSGPLTAYDRLRECAYLRAAALTAGPESAASFYAGNACRHSPIIVFLFSLLPSFTLPTSTSATGSIAELLISSLPPLLLIFAFELLLAVSAAAAACTVYHVQPVPVPRTVLAFACCAEGWSLPPVDQELPAQGQVQRRTQSQRQAPGQGQEQEQESESDEADLEAIDSDGASQHGSASNVTNSRDEAVEDSPSRERGSLSPRQRPQVPLPAIPVSASAASTGIAAGAIDGNNGGDGDDTRFKARGMSSQELPPNLTLSRPAPWLPAASLAALLCNPFSSLTAAALSTASLAPALLAAAALAAARGRPVAAGALAAAAAHIDLSLLAGLLALPAVAALGAAARARSRSGTAGPEGDKGLRRLQTHAAIATAVSSIVSFAAIAAVACAFTPPSAAAMTAVAATAVPASAATELASGPAQALAQQWARARAWVWSQGTWLDASWGAYWLLSDTTPTVGLFWYLFLQLFTRFRVFFLLVLHAHPYVYALCLLWRFPRWPLLSFAAATAAATLFKPYPTVLDAALAAVTPLLHLPLVAHRARRPGVLYFFMAIVSCIGASMWSLWMDGSAGNANFFFFQSTLFTLSAALGVVELVSAARRLQSLPPGAVELVNATGG